MAIDLRYCGYKRIDVARIYGFNLLLLPVNLAGTVSSIVQGITASKSAFARTPKVKDRTVAPPFFVVAPYLMIALAAITFYSAYKHDRVENMAYASLNILLACYAVVAFIGIRNSIVDVWIHFTALLYKPAQPRRRAISRAARKAPPPAPADWRSVLQVGPMDAGHWKVSQPPRRQPPPQPELPMRGEGPANGRHRAAGPAPQIEAPARRTGRPRIRPGPASSLPGGAEDERRRGRPHQARLPPRATQPQPRGAPGVT